ncbi:ATP-binding protein [Psychrobacillus sp. NPDC096389]|uniref:ATP-binding protein n=1 Tax=Psychrobacillus sp. NPDC096389 TaxID=3364490 RepID=UPI00381D7E22
MIYFQNPPYDLNLTLYDLNIFILLLIVIITTSIVNTLFEKKYWANLSDQNQSMRKELNSREGYLQLFFDNAKDSIAVFDTNNKVIEVNPAFEKLYGWKREEIIGQNIQFVPLYNKEIVELRMKEINEGVSYSLLETQEMKKDGSLFDAELTLSPIYDHDGQLIASSVISRDISYKKESEKLLLQSEKLKMAGEIAAGMAHEVRNPMTAISGFVQLMGNHPEYPYSSYTKVIEKEIERINYIISEFLVLAKPHLTTAKKYHLKTTLDDILMLFQSELNLKGIVYSNEWSAGDAYIFGEETQMKQVLTNIIKNAIEAITENGKIKICSTIEQENIVLIKITDNGVGMDEETLQNIFSPFFTTKEKGTGLGMMISEKIIADHGGKIFIESEIETGTSVTIQLPFTLEE